MGWFNGRSTGWWESFELCPEVIHLVIYPLKIIEQDLKCKYEDVP